MRGALTEARFPFLSRLGRDRRDELARLVPIRVSPGRRLLRQGDLAHGAYLVLSGSLRVYYLTGDGREATLYHVEPGGTCILALTSTMNEEPYPAWVEAGPRGAEYVRLPTTSFVHLLETEPAFRGFVFGALSGRVFDLMRTLEETGSARVEQRVARYLLRSRDPDDCVRITQLGIASDLGTAREVVFRVLRSFAERGLVETGRMRIRIRDRPGLERVAETTARKKSAARVT